MSTQYTFTEGQIVKLFHNRPEDAYAPAEAPDEFLRSYAQWNDRNGEYDDMDRRDLLAVAEQWELEAMSSELAQFCKAEGLPFVSADEIPAKNDHQRQWLSGYVRRWDEMVRAFAAARP